MELQRISIEGYKTIVSLQNFELGRKTILIGPNGGGKSNLIAFFRFVSHMLSGNLNEHVALSGGAARLLHDGPARTRLITGHLEAATDTGLNEYAFDLGYAAQDQLVFLHEKYRYSRRGAGQARWRELDAGHKESQLESLGTSDQTAAVIHGLLRKVIVHQFHNTSHTSRIKEKWRTSEGRWLKEDAGNLAPFLYRLRNEQYPFYRRIVDTLRSTLPFFSDFVLEPEHESILLQWRETGSDLVFDASQASDGMLRFLALVALLRQPESDLPAVLILDEPELGLHPHAIQVFTDMVEAASVRTQILIATQSTSLVDRFEPSDIVVVEREGRASTFRRLGASEYEEWLEEYTLSELWEKNVIGGRPR